MISNRASRYGKSTQHIALLKANRNGKIACLTKESKLKLIKQGVLESQIICSEEMNK